MKTTVTQKGKRFFFTFDSEPDFFIQKSIRLITKVKNTFRKGFFRKSFLLILFSAFITIGQSQTAQNHLVKRGERPAINLLNVPADAYEHNILTIKFKPDQSKAIEQFIQNSRKGNTSTIGIAAVDELNSQYKVKSATSYFLSPALKSTFTERHKAWGFHLWVKLELEEDENIVEMVNAYQELAEIELAEPVYKKHLIGNVQNENYKNGKATNSTEWIPDDPLFNEQWHYHNTGQQNGTADCDIDLPEAWEIETGNSNVIVAVIDGGIQYTHPDLAANMWEGIGYNFVNNSSTIVPDDHGTHVAGTIAASNNNGIGVSGIAGGTGSGDGVRLMSCQVFIGYTGADGFHLAPIYAADNGAAITQNSWGYYLPDIYDQSILDAIDYFNVNGGGDALDGGISIFAAGNENASGQYYPGCYSGTFAVAATNNKDERTFYSNFDTWIDISAPGGETNPVQSGVLSTITASGYAFYLGTSMACPHVSGAAALILSHAYGQLTNTELTELLRNSTDDHYEFNPYYIGRLGSGRLNAHAALVETENYLIHEVINPVSFSVQALSSNEIDLEWAKSILGNDVMLVYSNDGIFGTPQDGTNYAIGQTIIGGGIVLYRGAETEFMHTGLTETTHYYYKIFSYNDGYKYSAGRQTQAWTQCNPFLSLPYEQDFNDKTSLPDCWMIQNSAGGEQLWEFGTVPGLLKGTTGNYAYFNCDKYGNDRSQDADLISPVFDFSDYTDVYISFNHYFKAYANNSANFYYSLDGGLSWILFKSWIGTTPNPSLFNQKIDPLAGQNNVRFKWNYTGSWGYYWCIDDVFISNSPINNKPDIVVNPESIESFVDAGGTDEQQLIIENNGESALFWSSIIQYEHRIEWEHDPVPEGKKTPPDPRVQFIMADNIPDQEPEAPKDRNETGIKNGGNHHSTIDFFGGGSTTSTTNRDEVILHYDGANFNSTGINYNGSFYIAARFPAELTALYAGYKLESVEIYIKDTIESAFVRVWGAGTTTSPGELLEKQAFNPIFNSWNNIVLINPVELDGNDIWVGFFGIQEAGRSSIGIDAGPKHPDGDWTSVDGGISWGHLSDYGYNNNWNIRAHIRDDLGYNWLTLNPAEGVVEAGNTQSVLVKFDAKDLSSGSYDAYIFILNNDPLDNFITVPALLNITTVGIEEQNTSLINVFPIPAKNEINVELGQEISQLLIIDSKGQVMFQQSVIGKTMETINISAFKSGVYILQYINNKGMRFNKKIVINS